MGEQPKRTPVRRERNHERPEKTGSGRAPGTFTESGIEQQISNREIDVRRPVRDEIPPPPPRPTPEKGED